MTIKEYYKKFDSDDYIKPVDCDGLSVELNTLKGRLKNIHSLGYHQISTKSYLIETIDKIRSYTREFRNICLDDTKRKWELYENIRKSLEDLTDRLDKESWLKL